ncbi:AlpA family transcriptional regulator [Bradyrhizobium sp. CCGUVB14]|uniref:helix-turn-helix transcriptional regulator n=1 Tax=Bradyrhizobium sp. CCGUVB14 TaxID=2949628 RepID=UPI0020B3654F|nr:hypothetical protein [Bradyrhizobium sp. CCGUVB14]MCP3446203.1 hypothetical protein [Bradyrhizobium sp. CCGUVB14]
MSARNAGSIDGVRDLTYGSVRPRLLTRQQAADYCNLSPSSFSNWVRLAKLPHPLPGTTRWDLKAIDIALDKLSGLHIETETSSSTLDEWREKRARRS